MVPLDIAYIGQFNYETRVFIICDNFIFKKKNHKKIGEVYKPSNCHRFQ